LKVAVFVDYIGAIGGGERVGLTLARALGGDVVTTDVNFESIKRLGFQDLRIVSLGNTLGMLQPPLRDATFQRITIFSYSAAIGVTTPQRSTGQTSGTATLPLGLFTI
jgi:hypothetical protein